jgi:hypothetical protein
MLPGERACVESLAFAFRVLFFPTVFSETVTRPKPSSDDARISGWAINQCPPALPSRQPSAIHG